MLRAANKKVALHSIHKKGVQNDNALAFISTGSRSLDALLGGGVRTGMVTDVFGASGAGKTQLCFSLCASCTRAGWRAVFVDTAGTFRPERVSEIAGREALDRITFVRALHTQDQVAALEKAEYSGPSRHVAVMSHLRQLAMLAITSDCAVVVTNMIRNVPTETGVSLEREFLGSSVSLYAHMRLKLSLEDPSRGWFHAEALQPPAGTVRFAITSKGVHERD
jgi:RecA/RadA recombinase